MSSEQPIETDFTTEGQVTRYGLYLVLTDTSVDKMRKPDCDVEVMLEYNGQRRECLFDELIVFMTGQSGS